jgi:hypothetical protein
MRLLFAGDGSFFRPFHLDTDDIIVRSPPSLPRLACFIDRAWLDFVAELNVQLWSLSPNCLEVTIPPVLAYIRHVNNAKKGKLLGGLRVKLGRFLVRRCQSQEKSKKSITFRVKDMLSNVLAMATENSPSWGRRVKHALGFDVETKLLGRSRADYTSIDTEHDIRLGILLTLDSACDHSESTNCFGFIDLGESCADLAARKIDVSAKREASTPNFAENKVSEPPHAQTKVSGLALEQEGKTQEPDDTNLLVKNEQKVGLGISLFGETLSRAASRKQPRKMLPQCRRGDDKKWSKSIRSIREIDLQPDGKDMHSLSYQTQVTFGSFGSFVAPSEALPLAEGKHLLSGKLLPKASIRNQSLPGDSETPMEVAGSIGPDCENAHVHHAITRLRLSASSAYMAPVTRIQCLSFWMRHCLLRNHSSSFVSFDTASRRDRNWRRSAAFWIVLGLLLLDVLLNFVIMLLLWCVQTGAFHPLARLKIEADGAEPGSSVLFPDTEAGCNRWPLLFFLSIYPGANLIAPSICTIAMLRGRIIGIKRGAAFLALSVVNHAVCIFSIWAYSDFINVQEALPLPLLAIACKLATLHSMSYFAGCAMSTRTAAGWNGLSTTTTVDRRH